mgnify:CR=1 FL=1
MERKYYSEKELEQYANIHSEEITIRSYDNGISHDTTRKSTTPEKIIIKNIIFGTLLAINAGASEDCKHSAEHIGKLLIPEMNGYFTIYIPIEDFIWEEER